MSPTLHLPGLVDVHTHLRVPGGEHVVEIDPEARYTLANDRLHTRCGWTPFAGMAVQGLVRRVTLRGQVVFDVDRPDALARPGAGQVIP